MQRYILYLEPGASNALLPHLLSFMEISHLIGVNEAQQYRPHCSVTGFFTIPAHDARGRGGEDPIEVLCEHISSALQRRAGTLSVKVGTVATSLPEKASDPSAPPAVRIELSTTGFRELAEQVKTLMARYRVSIRPKPVDHISLAYITNFPKVKGTSDGPPKFFESSCGQIKRGVVEYRFERYLEAAHRHFRDKLVDSSDWSLVLYEEEHSGLLSVPHRFHAVRQWNLTTSLGKKYPDR